MITVDSDEAGGRPNHVRSTSEAHEFYIRDVLLDWGRDDPNAFDGRAARWRAPDAGADRWTSRPRRPRAMMAHFADFTGKAQPRHVQDAGELLLLAWTADHTGAMRSQVYVARPVRARPRTRRSWST